MVSNQGHVLGQFSFCSLVSVDLLDDLLLLLEHILALLFQHCLGREIDELLADIAYRCCEGHGTVQLGLCL